MDITNSHRLILDLDKFNIDVFAEFGRYNYVSTQNRLADHQHQDMLEICFLSKGHQVYIVGEKEYELFGGDVFIAYPNEIHGTGEKPEEKGVLYWMILRKPQPGKDYLGLKFNEAAALFSELESIPNRRFQGGSDCDFKLRQIIQTYFQPITLLTRIEIANLIVSFLLTIVQKAKHKSIREYSDRISLVVKYINDSIFETVDLEYLASMSNLSLSRFKHLFKEEVGIPPSEYIVRMKLNIAQTLLKDCKLTIKDIAYDLDFSSPAYFSTVFKQYFGITPHEYQKCNHQ